MIEDADFSRELQHSRNLLVGLLFPTHGFMPPWSMIKFLFKLPLNRGASAICVATRGRINVVGPLFIPGAAGYATFIAAAIMMLKGYRIKAIFSLDMPSNFNNFHWGLHPQNVTAISEKALSKLERLTARIMDGHKIWFTWNNLYEALWCLLLFWLIPLMPIILPIGYLLFGRLYMAKLMFSNNRCVGCGTCARFCPNGAIMMKDIGKKKRPYWTYHCEVCLRCMGYCKKKAVESGHSWAILLYFLVSIPVMSYLLSKLSETFYSSFLLHFQFSYEILYFVDFFIALIISYWLFWHLIRIPVVNTVFTYTTLTRYYRRYHHPETKLRHMKSIKSIRTDS